MEEKLISNNNQAHLRTLKHLKKWYQKFWGILLIAIFSLFFIFLIASTIFIYKQVQIYKQYGFLGENSQNIKIYSKAEIETSNNNYFGAKNPKITIVEFSDYACPNSLSFFKKTRKLRMKYYTDLKIIHRDFPIIADYSMNLALAARCAGEEGLFWKANDALYDNQGISSKSEIFSLMQKIGVDKDKFSDCYNSNRYLSLIKKDLQDGIKLGIKGTPTWFINGYRANGNMPEDILNSIIESMLSNK